MDTVLLYTWFKKSNFTPVYTQYVLIVDLCISHSIQSIIHSLKVNWITKFIVSLMSVLCVWLPFDKHTDTILFSYLTHFLPLLYTLTSFVKCNKTETKPIYYFIANGLCCMCIVTVKSDETRLSSVIIIQNKNKKMWKEKVVWGSIVVYVVYRVFGINLVCYFFRAWMKGILLQIF